MCLRVLNALTLMASWERLMRLYLRRARPRHTLARALDRCHVIVKRHVKGFPCHFGFGKSRLIAKAEFTFCSGNAQSGYLFLVFLSTHDYVAFSARRPTRTHSRVLERSTTAGHFVWYCDRTAAYLFKFSPAMDFDVCGTVVHISERERRFFRRAAGLGVRPR